MPRITRSRAGVVASAALALAGITCLGLSAPAAFAAPPVDNSANTTTPIKHVVVIFDENESFDHYFGTYPNAANTDGTPFTAAAGTPIPNNYTSHPALLTANPNATQPKRLTHAEALTCSQNHGYTPEQKAVDGGAMDKFVENTQAASGCATGGQFFENGEVMDYFDGNTATGEWNYAQNYAMSDNSWDAAFGPSTVGAINLISGQTHGALSVASTGGVPTQNASGVAGVPGNTPGGVGTVNGDPDPAYDDCADVNHTRTDPLVQMQGKNIGDLLNDKGVTWGWFEGGFAPVTPWNGAAGSYAQCTATMTNIGGNSVVSYSPHHEPFEYYASTSNPHHLAPASAAEIGHDGQANHNYDMAEFDKTLAAGNLPAVSFLKPAQAQDAHPSNSDPIDEQNFIVKEINAIQQSPEWASTSIIISYDDSDGWYDHVAPTILNGSTDSATDTSECTSGPAALGGYLDRCGPSQRLPLLVISPFAKQNYIDHTLTTQPSVLKFVEDNWQTGRIGDSSLDASAGSIDGMFDFASPQLRRVLLAADGSVASVTPITAAAPTGPAATDPTAADPQLAATGANATVPIIGGALLLGAGAVLLFTRRRFSRK